MAYNGITAVSIYGNAGPKQEIWTSVTYERRDWCSVADMGLSSSWVPSRLPTPLV